MRQKPKYVPGRTIVEAHVSEHDHETPVCPECGDHIGEHNDAVLILRGQFFYRKDEGYAMFVLDPDTKVQFCELPDALGPDQPQFAVIVDAESPDPIVPMHAECVHAVLDDDEEDDDDEPDPIDELNDEFRRRLDREPDDEMLLEEDMEMD